MPENRDWWKRAVFYQIYPRSFMDSNADGVGDLDGINRRLDYLAELGIDALWISPVYPSPMKDFGYDVSDHEDIDPLFGDLAAFDRLIAAAHERGLRVVMDYVPNHTSDQHRWFRESRLSTTSPKRDWYIWKDARPDGSPPNNWESIFGGPAWHWDEASGQYYLHLFLQEQPDLNWRNPEVVEAMENVLRFWLDRGVDGFRMDAVMLCIKQADFRDNPPVAGDSPWKKLGLTLEPLHTLNQPELHHMLRRFRALLDGYPSRPVMIGETWLFDPAELAAYYGPDLDEFQIPFNFMGTRLPWEAAAVRDALEAYYAALPEGATPNFVLGNHDVHRLATRFGYDNHRSAGLLLLTLWGIPTMYYGDEIGMQDVPIGPAESVDPWGLRRPGLDIGRDPARTPMQWDATLNAGFSPPKAKPWLPLASNYRERNVAAQREDTASTLNFYKALLRLRREHPALQRGGFAFVDPVPGGVLAYVRSAEGQRLLVAINFEASAKTVDLSALGGAGELLLSTHATPAGAVASALTLGPHESALILLSA